jgi:hypothetical protein
MTICDLWLDTSPIGTGPFSNDFACNLGMYVSANKEICRQVCVYISTDREHVSRWVGRYVSVSR